MAQANHCENVVILNLQGLTSIADYFVIATGTSDRQMRATVDHIDDYAEKIGQKRYGLAGYDTAHWILADYVDVVIHVFDETHRRYYDLDLMWGDAPRIEWEREDSK